MSYWTPYGIKIILHHYVTNEKFEYAHAPAYQSNSRSMVEQGLLTPTELGGSFDVTEKGRALIQSWLDTPIPTMKWVDPRFDNESPLKAKQMGVGE